MAGQRMAASVVGVGRRRGRRSLLSRPAASARPRYGCVVLARIVGHPFLAVVFWKTGGDLERRVGRIKISRPRSIQVAEGGDDNSRSELGREKVRKGLIAQKPNDVVVRVVLGECR